MKQKSLRWETKAMKEWDIQRRCTAGRFRNWVACLESLFQIFVRLNWKLLRSFQLKAKLGVLPSSSTNFKEAPKLRRVSHLQNDATPLRNSERTSGAWQKIEFLRKIFQFSVNSEQSIPQFSRSETFSWITDDFLPHASEFCCDFFFVVLVYTLLVNEVVFEEEKNNFYSWFSFFDTFVARKNFEVAF